MTHADEIFAKIMAQRSRHGRSACITASKDAQDRLRALQAKIGWSNIAVTQFAREALGGPQKAFSDACVGKYKNGEPIKALIHERITTVITMLEEQASKLPAADPARFIQGPGNPFRSYVTPE